MTVAIPARPPDYSLAWDYPGSVTRRIRINGGPDLEVSGPAASEYHLRVGSDARGNYLSRRGDLEDGPNSLDFSAPGDVPAIIPAQAVTIRLATSMPAGAFGQVTARLSSELGVVGAKVDDLAGPWSWESEFYPAGIVEADTDYAERRVRFTESDYEWSVHTAIDGAMDPDASGSGTAPAIPAISPPWTALFQGVSPDYRVYAWDVWIDRLPGKGMWTQRQRQTAGGNAGGWPSRQRQNGGHTGAWSARQRQTGI